MTEKGAKTESQAQDGSRCRENVQIKIPKTRAQCSEHTSLSRQKSDGRQTVQSLVPSGSAFWTFLALTLFCEDAMLNFTFSFLPNSFAKKFGLWRPLVLGTE